MFKPQKKLKSAVAIKGLLIKTIYYPFLLVLISSCNQRSSLQNVDQWKEEIREAEQQFAEMAEKEGIQKAFGTFAANDAVIKRRGDIIKGVDGITDFYDNADPNETLSWSPDFVDVSASGDLGYTYGSFTFTWIDSLGNKSENTGIFHTVWKRQKDGSWKYVWD